MGIVVKLANVMAKRRVTLTELAERIDITPANLSKIKNGHAKAIRFSTLEALCHELHCLPAELIDYEE